MCDAVQTVNFWQFLCPAFPASRVQHISDLGLHCEFGLSMVDIQSATAEIRRGRKKEEELEMWANAQRDSRPAVYRWRLLFNAAKFG